MIKKLISLTKDNVKFIKDIAEKKGLSFSEMMRRIIDWYKDERRKNKW